MNPYGVYSICLFHRVLAGASKSSPGWSLWKSIAQCRFGVRIKPRSLTLNTEGIQQQGKETRDIESQNAKATNLRVRVPVGVTD